MMMSQNKTRIVKLSTGSSTASLVPSTSTVSSVSPLTTRKRKRSATKLDNVIIEMIDSVIKAQLKGDERMLELEEKRLQMEEKQLEREAQQHREDSFSCKS